MQFEESFRDYQVNAIKLSVEYFDRHKKNTETGAALVCHPTGTGKTAVIAGISQCVEDIGTSLVLCTRQAIRDQLSSELSGNLYIKKFQVEDIPKKPVILIQGSSDFDKKVKSLISYQIKDLEPKTVKAVCENVKGGVKTCHVAAQKSSSLAMADCARGWGCFFNECGIV